MENSISRILDEALSETTALLETVDKKDINTVPFEGSWTAAQVGRHLLKAERGMDKLFLGPAESVDRAPDQNVEGLKKMFLDFSTKMQSPEYILPEEKEYDKEKLISDLQEVRIKVIEAVNAADLNQVPPLPEGNPFIGNTKLELAHFMAYHARRHNHQIKNILEVLKSR